GTARGPRQARPEADPRRVPQGQVADPGRCRPRVGQEQGRPPAGHRAVASARRGGRAAIPELPLSVAMDNPLIARALALFVVLFVVVTMVLGMFPVPSR